LYYNSTKFTKLTSNGRITLPAKLRTEEIKANAGFLGMKGILLKALMKEKGLEKEF
jgi:hypothetical protein